MMHQKSGNKMREHATAPVAAAAVAACLLIEPSAHGAIAASLVGRIEGRVETCAFNPALGWDSNAASSPLALSAFQNDFEQSNGNPFRSWALELGPTVDGGAVYIFDPIDLPGGGIAGARAVVLRDLFARWIDPSTERVAGGTEGRAATAAAFQLAVWEIAHENFGTNDAATLVSRMSMTTGAFRALASAETAARYAAMTATLGVGGFRSHELEVLANPVAQDQVRVVPAPAAMIVLLGGALGACHSRRRRAPGVRVG